MSNELGRLAQGNKYGVKATDTMEFIKQEDVQKIIKSQTQIVCVTTYPLNLNHIE